jgi:hypothetical protein
MGSRRVGESGSRVSSERRANGFSPMLRPRSCLANPTSPKRQRVHGTVPSPTLAGFSMHSLALAHTAGMHSLALRARRGSLALFDVAPFGFRPEWGSDKSARGNAPGIEPAPFHAALKGPDKGPTMPGAVAGLRIGVMRLDAMFCPFRSGFSRHPARPRGGAPG